MPFARVAAIGTRGIVAVSGEAGAAKTRLCAELGRLAKARGAAFLVGRCLEGRAPATERPVDKRHLGKVSVALRDAAAEAPLVVVIDNLHCAGRLSLDLLEFIAPATATAPMLLVVTYRPVESRPPHPSSATLGALASEPGYRPLPLVGLGQADVAGLVRYASGVAAPAELAAAAVIGRTSDVDLARAGRALAAILATRMARARIVMIGGLPRERGNRVASAT